MELYDIYIRSFAAGDAAAEGVARVFRIDARRAQDVLRSLPRVVKRRVAADELDRYRKVLGQLGAQYEFRPSPILPQRIIAIESGAGEEQNRDDVSGYALTLPPPDAEPALPIKPQPVLGTFATIHASVEEMLERERQRALAREREALATVSCVPEAEPETWPVDRTEPGHEPDWEALGESSSAPEVPAPAPVPAQLPQPVPSRAPAARERAADKRLVGLAAPTLPTFGTLIEAPKPAPAEPAAAGTARAESLAPARLRAEPTQSGAGAPLVPAALPPVSIPAAPTISSIAPSACVEVRPSSPWESTPLHAVAADLTQAAAAAPVPIPPPGTPAFAGALDLKYTPIGSSSPMAVTGWSKRDAAAGFDFSDRPAWLSDERALRERMQEGVRDGVSVRPNAVSLPGAEHLPPLELAPRLGEVAQSSRPPPRPASLPPPSVRPPAPLLPGDPMAAVLGGAPLVKSSRPPPLLDTLDDSDYAHPTAYPTAYATARPPSRMPPSARVARRRNRSYFGDSEALPLPLRIVWRGVAGVMMFALATLATHCHLRGSSVDRALETWAQRAGPEAGPVPEEQQGRFGPFAGPWLDASIHQVADGDKDVARSRINDFILAGAPQVYIGNTIKSGPVEIATELIVEVPPEPDKRARVIELYQRYLDSRGGGQAPANAEKLIIALN